MSGRITTSFLAYRFRKCHDWDFRIVLTSIMYIPPCRISHPGAFLAFAGPPSLHPSGQDLLQLLCHLG